MLINIDHLTKYSYSAPQKSLIQILRLTPQNSANQYISNWNINLDVDATLTPFTDAFGNLCHTLAVDKTVEGLTIETIGTVETYKNSGTNNEGFDPLPPLVYCRNTPLTQPNKAIVDFAKTVAKDGNKISQLHNILSAIYNDFTFEVGATSSTTDAITAFEAKKGVCQDLAHIFIAASRALGIPSRYVSGHLLRTDGADYQEAAHGWAQSHVDGLGWISFDPANGICTNENYVQVAIGLDYSGAAPVSGARYGGGHETLSVDIHVRQSQSQKQS